MKGNYANTFETLERNNLINKIVLDNQMKYSLTMEGCKLGEKHYIED